MDIYIWQNSTKRMFVIRDKIKRLKESDSKGSVAIYAVLRKLYIGVQLFTDKRLRSETISWLRYGSHFHQRYTTTVLNRYPDLFKVAAEYLNKKPEAKILSFGCSTGEEVFTLAEYMPNATIMGTDINRWCIGQARKSNKSNRLSFSHRRSAVFERQKDFDAIFCLAVFQRTENRNVDNQVAKTYTFRHFEKEVVMLNDKLKKDGLLIIDQSDFNFMDTTCAADYEVYDCENNKVTRNRPLYDKNNRRVSSVSDNYRVFKKK